MFLIRTPTYPISVILHNPKTIAYSFKLTLDLNQVWYKDRRMKGRGRGHSKVPVPSIIEIGSYTKLLWTAREWKRSRWRRKSGRKRKENPVWVRMNTWEGEGYSKRSLVIGHQCRSSVDENKKVGDPELNKLLSDSNAPRSWSISKHKVLCQPLRGWIVAAIFWSILMSLKGRPLYFKRVEVFLKI